VISGVRCSLPSAAGRQEPRRLAWFTICAGRAVLGGGEGGEGTTSVLRAFRLRPLPCGQRSTNTPIAPACCWHLPGGRDELQAFHSELPHQALGRSRHGRRDGSSITTNLPPRLIDLLFQRAQGGVCLLDSGGNVRRANAEWLRLLGRSIEMVGGEGVPGRLEEIRRRCTEAGWDLDISPVALDGGDGILVTVTERAKPGASSADSTIAASEARHRMVFNSMTEAFALHEIVLDSRGEPCDYRFLEMNPAFERLTGLPSSKVLGKAVTEALPGLDPEWIKIYGKVALTGQPIQFDRFEAVLNKHYEVLAFCPAPRQFAVLFLDITERKRAEMALRESERHYRLLADNVLDVIWTFDLRTRRLTYVSPSIMRLRGLTVEEALSEPVEKSFTPESLAEVLGLLARMGTSREEDPHVGVYDQHCKDGSIRHVEMTTAYLRDDSGQPVQVLGVSRDATARVNMERALGASEERYRKLIAELPIGIFHATAHDGCTFLNVAGQQLTGLAESEASGRGWTRVLHAGDAAKVSSLWADVAAMKGAFDREYQLERKDGQTTWVKAWVTESTGPGSGGEALVGALVDITGQKAAEKALRESEELHRTVVTHMAEGVLVQDARGAVLAMNPVAGNLIGPVADRMNQPSTIVPRERVIREDGSPVPPEEFPVAVALRTGEPQLAGVVGIVRPDESVTWVRGNTIPLKDAEGRVTRLVTTISDISERRALREQLTVAARIAAMGTLVGGVAHEINNPLAGAMASNAFVSEALRTLAGTVRNGELLDSGVLARQLDESVEALADAQEGARRIASIVRSLAVFGRPDTKRTPVRLQNIVESAVQGLPAEIRARTTIRVEPGEPVEVLASTAQLEQTVVNLVTNAALAIPEGRACDVTIRFGTNPTRRMHYLEVADNGTGIEPKVLERIFDPFFTTREVGRGMGLGLPICYAIVMAHGGALTVKSVPGKGSTFRVELPAISAKA
jgi:PAS domain S-box-containing protein